ncbi:UNVERIFIED_CONTAM: hypothetical protein GTU68_031999 [Idotea baltica]|nr:hypothetical protein [Idotea baltica]
MTTVTELPPRFLHELEKVIAGQRDHLELVLATLLSQGHLLLEDRPGVGKTVLARALGIVFGVPFGRIQGTPDLLPTDVTGVHVFQPNTGEWEFRAGPVFTSLLLVDELNRATPKAQSALLEAMAEGQVTIDGHTYGVGTPFMVIATQNPRGEVGTHALGHAQIDRFATMLELGLPGRDAERMILAGHAGIGQLSQLQPVLAPGDLPTVFAHVNAVRACESIIEYVLSLIEAVRDLDPSIWLSVRVAQTLLGVARGQAFMHQRDYVAPEDVQKSTMAVLAHRLPRSIEHDAVRAALEQVPVPVDAH